MKKFIVLKDLEVYKLSRELSKLSWKVYESLNFEEKKVMGDQFIRSSDSVGANIAEGYSRYHYLDKIRFYYNSRASLVESCEHWLELLSERKKIKEKNFSEIKSIYAKLSIKLNNFINSTYESRKK